MIKMGVHKKLKSVLFVFMALVFCVFPFSFLVTNFVSATSEDDYDSFNSTLIDMYKNDEKVATMSLDESADEDEEWCSNRLIVSADSKLNSRGAIAKAEYQDLHIFQYKDTNSMQDAMEYFSALKNVESVEVDEKISCEDVEEIEQIDEISALSDSYLSWGAKFTGYSEYIDTLAESSSTCSDVIVAVLDSGIYTSHQLFKDRILLNYGKNFTDEASGSTYEFEDLNGHGTHVAGIIADATKSTTKVPFNVKILPLKVLDSNGDGYVSMIVNAISYVERLVSQKTLNVRLMNMSIGVKRSSSANVTATSTSLTNQVVSAYNKGILSIVSAGNERSDTYYCSPANVECAVTISALYQSSDSSSVYFDSGYSNYGNEVDFSAPGTNIQSAGLYATNSYVRMSGTSMAAPHATACFALVCSNSLYDSYTPAQLVDLMQSNAVDLGDTGKDIYYGYGSINVANIGVINKGYVEFSKEEEACDSEFKLSLSFDMSEFEATNYCAIYYSLDENAKTVDTTSTLYTNPITISQTTKVTAVAYVYSQRYNGVLLQKSLRSTKTYYFDNTDVLSNYYFDDDGAGGVYISKYSGKLTTLNAPSSYNSKYVTGVGYRAFNSSKVETLTLPSTVSTLYRGAFNTNTKIKSITCMNSQIEVGESAFRYSSIKTLNMPGIKTIGNLAFANCQALNELELPYVTEIGANAFSASKVKTLLIGKNITTIKNQINVGFEKIYGYAGTVAQTYLADEFDCEFVDLTLKITKQPKTRYVVGSDDKVVVSLNVSGVSVTARSGNGTTLAQTYLKNAEGTELGEFENRLDVTFSDWGSFRRSFSYFVAFTDLYGDTISSDACMINVVDSTRTKHAFNFDDAGNFSVYVDGEKITSGTEFFEGFDYEIKIVPNDGIVLKNVKIDGVEKTIGEAVTIDSLSSDVSINVVTDEEEILTVNFDIDSGCGSVLVDGISKTQTQVVRGENLTFEVKLIKGYVIKSVSIDGVVATATDGKYVIENVTSNKNVRVVLEESNFTLTITQGNGGTYSTSGVNGNVMAQGSKVIIKLSTSKGYILDSVIINGEVYEITGDTIVLNDVQQDYDIVIECNKSDMFVDENSVIVKYLVVFAVLFVLFLLGRMVLHFIRKENDRM